MRALRFGSIAALRAATGRTKEGSRVVLLEACTFQPVRFLALLSTLLLCIYATSTTSAVVFARGTPTNMLECQALWRWCNGFAVTLVICLLPDLFALTLEHRLITSLGVIEVPGGGDGGDAAVDTTFVTGAFTQSRLWRGAQASFGMALLMCAPLCFLCALLILTTTHCIESDAELLWLLLTVPHACVIGLGVLCNFGSGGGRLAGLSGRASQTYIALSAAAPPLAWLFNTDDNSVLGSLLRRWTRANALTLVGLCAMASAQTATAWFHRLRIRLAHRTREERAAAHAQGREGSCKEE